MNVDNDLVFASLISQTERCRIGPMPSLRIPVTAANRALLRRLRAAELSAWLDPTTSANVAQVARRQNDTLSEGPY